MTKAEHAEAVNYLRSVATHNTWAYGWIKPSDTGYAAAVDMLGRAMEFLKLAHELGCFIDDGDPDTTKLWDRAEAVVREWDGKDADCD